MNYGCFIFSFFPFYCEGIISISINIKEYSKKMLAVLAKVRTLRQHEEQRSRSKMEKEQNVIQR